MKYGELIRRSWDIFRNNLFLAGLGYLGAVLGMSTQIGRLPSINGLVIAVLQIVLVSINYVVMGAIAAAVSQIESEGASSFVKAWRAVSGKALILIAIGLPQNTLLIMSSYGASSFSYRASSSVMPILGWVCGSLIAGFVLWIMGQFAYMACTLEHTDFVGSYRRGWAVLTQNLGQVVLLFLVLVVVVMAVGIVFAVPILCLESASSELCSQILVLIIGGPLNALVYTLWTLAYREWAGMETREKQSSTDILDRAE